MASLRHTPAGSFIVCFRYQGQQFQRALKTKDPGAAKAAMGRVEDALYKLSTGDLAVPPGVSPGDFIVWGEAAVAKARKEPEAAEPKEPVPTLGGLIEAYLHSNQGLKADTSLGTERSHLKTLKKCLAAKVNLPADRITRSDLDGVLRQRRKEVEPVTVKKERQTIMLLFAWAVRNSHLPASPAEDLETIRGVLEAQVIGGRERFLLYLVNWGGQPHPLTVRVHAPYAVSGAYVMRDVQDRAWPRQGRTVSAKTLNAGLRLDLPVQMPKVLLFESAASGRRLKLRRISPKRKAVLARIEAMKRNPLPSDRPKALFVADRKGERRTELLGKIVHPLAVQVLEREGYDVHWLDYRDLTPERLKTFALFVLVEDSKLKISVLHRNREFRRRVRAYVREGGSLLLAGSGSVHYNANNRFIRYLLTQPYKIKAVSFCKNPKSCGFGDPLQLTVRTFAKHPLTEHVKALQFFVCAGLSGTSPGFTPVAFAEKSDLNHPGAPLVLAGEVGDGGRMVVATDNTWMQPFRIEEADNAQFLVNTIRWLGRKPVKRIHKPSFIASLFITEKLMREIEKEEQ